MNQSDFGFNLGSIFRLNDFKTRSISAENPTGTKSGGALSVPSGNNPAVDLGQGWKVRPYITLEVGSVTTLAQIDGPGLIQHIWITADPKAYRSCILRIFWDYEQTPSVEVPLGDFFACGHGLRYPVNSLPVSVNPLGGLNCYWPMPFQKHVEITIENQYWEKIDQFFYQINYALGDVGDNAANFHAQWRRKVSTREKPEIIIVDDIKGKGHYVGTFLSWTQLSDGWWGEGEVKFYIDGDYLAPTICGTGTEDYFGGAWAFGETYTTPFLGYPLWKKDAGGVPKHALYRWHIMDPICFDQDLRVTCQTLGWWPSYARYQPLADDIASVAYWYQKEPHVQFPDMISLYDRLPR
jgi:hypothetical protein